MFLNYSCQVERTLTMGTHLLIVNIIFSLRLQQRVPPGVWQPEESRVARQLRQQRGLQCYSQGPSEPLHLPLLSVLWRRGLKRMPM